MNTKYQRIQPFCFMSTKFIVQINISRIQNSLILPISAHIENQIWILMDTYHSVLDHEIALVKLRETWNLIVFLTEFGTNYHSLCYFKWTSWISKFPFSCTWKCHFYQEAWKQIFWARSLFQLMVGIIPILAKKCPKKVLQGII